LHEGANLVLMAPFTYTNLEAFESPDAEECVDDIDDPEELPIWGHLASSIATRLAGPNRMLSVLRSPDYLEGLPRAVAFLDTCQPIPAPHVPFLKRDVLAWLKVGRPLRPACLCDVAPEDIPDFQFSVSMGLCPLEGYESVLKESLLSSGENRFEQDDFRKCKFMIVPAFTYSRIGDGAAIDIYHRPELTDTVKRAARQACHDLGMEWQE